MTDQAINEAVAKAWENSERARFLAKVNVPHSGCWEWTGSIAPNGYGQFVRKSGSRQAHRISYELFCGEIPDGLHVCHRCDNRKCVRPSHLFVGTMSDNMQDMIRKGRQNLEAKRRAARTMLKTRHVHKGERNHAHKLTQSEVEEIKHTRIVRGTKAAIAKAYGVSATVIGGILNGTRWK